MEMLDLLDDLFPDTVTVTPVQRDVDGHVVTNDTGAPVYQEALSFEVDAWVGGRLTIVRDRLGNERQSSQVAVLKGSFGVTVEDKFTLPERFTPREPSAIAVSHATDEDGAHHETVYF